MKKRVSSVMMTESHLITTKQPISKKKKKLYIAVPIIILLIIIKVFSGGGHPTDEEVINAAKYEVSQSIISRFEPTFSNVKIVDKDNHNRFIVSLDDSDKWYGERWIVWIEFDKKGEYYHSFCNYQGANSSKYGYLDRGEYIELFKTNPDFSWGEDTWVRKGE